MQKLQEKHTQKLKYIKEKYGQCEEIAFHIVNLIKGQVLHSFFIRGQVTLDSKATKRELWQEENINEDQIEIFVII
jgi:hypothetical protein